MKTNTEGLVLMSRAAGDKDKLLTILTRDNGVLHCFARGASVVGNRNFSVSQALIYANFTIYRGHNRCAVDEARLLHSFFEPSMELERIALEQYFCELAMKLVPENTESSAPLDLLLNCLYLIKSGHPLEKIKSVFEVRLVTLCGWMPNLLYCQECGAYEDETMYFYPQENVLRCRHCYREAPCGALSKGALMAFRYLTYAEPKKIFSFQVAPASLHQLSWCSEQYLLCASDTVFGTLDYYHQVTSPFGEADASSKPEEVLTVPPSQTS